MAPHTFHHQERSVSMKPYYMSGIIAGSVGFVVLLCLLCLLRYRRSRANRKRMLERSTGSFRVRGVVRPMMAETSPVSTSPVSTSRQGLTESIVIPEKSIIRKPSSHGLSDKAVVSFQLEPSPTSPTTSRRRPLSNTSGAPRPSVLSILNPLRPQHSRSSSGFSAFAQLHPFVPLNSRPSSVISMSPSQVRPVKQLFVPALPDELALVRYGECLTVFRTFDDGWCLVTRDTTRASWVSPPSIWTTTNDDNTGLVPSWVFIKPLKGITVTRPFRNESINALHHFGQNALSPHTRNAATIPWSNFT